MLRSLDGDTDVGDLSDHSYFKARGKERVSASGEVVRMEQFEERDNRIGRNCDLGGF